MFSTDLNSKETNIYELHRGAPTIVGFLYKVGLLIVSIRSRAHSYGLGDSE